MTLPLKHQSSKQLKVLITPLGDKVVAYVMDLIEYQSNFIYTMFEANMMYDLLNTSSKYFVDINNIIARYNNKFLNLNLAIINIVMILKAWIINYKLMLVYLPYRLVCISKDELHEFVLFYQEASLNNNQHSCPSSPTPHKGIPCPI